jgi:tRNA(fMet)-specific endonuclease VapC
LITHLLDTDVCIHALKKRSRPVMQQIVAHEGRMAVSDVTLFELLHGAAGCSDPEHRTAVIEEFASQLAVLPFDTKSAYHAAAIRSKLEKTGNVIGPYDTFIAAIARTQSLILATGNVREFKRVEGLRVEKWS